MRERAGADGPCGREQERDAGEHAHGFGGRCNGHILRQLDRHRALRLSQPTCQIRECRVDELTTYRPCYALRTLSLRRNKKLGPARIAGRPEVPASTVHAVLARNQVSRLAWMDRRQARRLHVDIKKLGQVPPGGCSSPTTASP